MTDIEAVMKFLDLASAELREQGVSLVALVCDEEDVHCSVSLAVGEDDAMLNFVAMYSLIGNFNDTLATILQKARTEGHNLPVLLALGIPHEPEGRTLQ